MGCREARAVSQCHFPNPSLHSSLLPHFHPLMHSLSLTSILTLTFLFLLLASFPRHSHSDITLKRGNTTLFHATSFKLLFMNNSFTPFEAPIVPLSFPLPSTPTQGVGVDSTLNGSIALVATSLDSFSPYTDPAPSYNMIRALRMPFLNPPKQ